MTARWAANTAYTAGTIILPTVDNGRCFYCATGGTSNATTEPTWPARFSGTGVGGVTDGTAVWVPYTIVTPQSIRDINGWDTTTGRYADTIIGNHLLDSINELERACVRYFVNRPGFTLQITSNGAPILPIPGIRTASSVIWMGSTQVAGLAGGGGSGYALLPDVLQSGVYTAIQFRPLRSPDANGPWWLSLGGATTNWFDTGADNPFDPRNYGGGYVYTSTALDTVLVGDWGYAPGSEPMALFNPLEVLASWHCERPLSLLSDSVITPQGGVLSFANMPAEVRQFTTDWRTGRQAVSVG